MKLKLLLAYLWWVGLVVPIFLFVAGVSAIKESHSSTLRLLLSCALFGMSWVTIWATAKAFAWSRRTIHSNTPEARRRTMRLMRPPRS